MTDSISALFEKAVDENPDQTAIIQDDITVSYLHLDQRANQFAHFLKSQGFADETPIAICMDRSIELMVAMFGILKAGLAYIPLDPTSPPQRLAFTLSDCKAPLLITSAQYDACFQSYAGKKILWHAHLDTLDTFSTARLTTSPISQNLAYILYTSGSSGNPKGVLIEHRALLHYTAWFGKAYGFLPHQRVDFSANYIFDMSLSISVVPLLLGWTVVVCSDEIKKDSRLYLHHLHHYRIHLVKMIPSYLRVLMQTLRHSFIALPDLKAVGVGGERFFTNDCKDWLSLYPHHVIFNEYGPTEATIAVTHFKITADHLIHSSTSIPIGFAADDLRYYLKDELGNPVENDAVGELYVAGAQLARGYLNQPLLTETRFLTSGFPERVYKTGDLCKQRADGCLEFIGRTDAQIKLRGFRIEPEEIEQGLMRHPLIKDAVVVVRPENPNQLVAYLVPVRYPLSLTTRALCNYLKAHLPHYMIPNLFVDLPSLPLTPTGKIDIKALPAPIIKRKSTTRKASSQVEKQLKTIWSQELGLTRIDNEDNFFELGGHSLSAARIISEINNRFQKVITLEAFYQKPTVAALACLLEQTLKEKQLNQLQLTSRSKPWPLGDFQFILWLSNQFEPKASKLNIVAQRRLKGRLDYTALKQALTALQKKHLILTSKPLVYRPGQRFNLTTPLKLVLTDLSHLSIQQAEARLQLGFIALLHHTWKGQSPLVLSVYHLPNKYSEIHLCTPHIISDDVSPDILYKDLSEFYLAALSATKPEEIHPETLFREYISEEQAYFKQFLNRDLSFWKGYLREAKLFAFPAEAMLDPEKHHTYSTYCKIEEQQLLHLKLFCARMQISIQDGLCAVIGKALSKLSSPQKNILINRVKSTRSNHRFDKTVGCFLSLDPIILDLDPTHALSTLAKSVHHSSIKTLPFQRASSVIKLACVDALCRKKSLMSTLFLKGITYFYSILFRGPASSRKILNYCVKLAAPKHARSLFLVNVNVQSQFLAPAPKVNRTTLFGLPKTATPSFHYDLLRIDQFLDICFLKEHADAPAYVVISANLKPEFRQNIANEMVAILQQETQPQLESSVEMDVS